MHWTQDQDVPQCLFHCVHNSRSSRRCELTSGRLTERVSSDPSVVSGVGTTSSLGPEPIRRTGVRCALCVGNVGNSGADDKAVDFCELRHTVRGTTRRVLQNFLSCFPLTSSCASRNPWRNSRPSCLKELQITQQNCLRRADKRPNGKRLTKWSPFKGALGGTVRRTTLFIKGVPPCALGTYVLAVLKDRGSLTTLSAYKWQTSKTYPATGAGAASTSGAGATATKGTGALYSTIGAGAASTAGAGATNAAGTGATYSATGAGTENIADAGALHHTTGAGAEDQEQARCTPPLAQTLRPLQYQVGRPSRCPILRSGGRSQGSLSRSCSGPEQKNKTGP